MNFWVLLVALAAITFFNRYLFFAKLVKFRPSEPLQRFLGYSMYAILTAIWAPIVFEFSPSQGFTHAGVDFLLGMAIATTLTVFKAPSIVVVLVSAAAFFVARTLL